MKSERKEVLPSIFPEKLNPDTHQVLAILSAVGGLVKNSYNLYALVYLAQEFGATVEKRYDDFEIEYGLTGPYSSALAHDLFSCFIPSFAIQERFAGLGVKPRLVISREYQEMLARQSVDPIVNYVVLDELRKIPQGDTYEIGRLRELADWTKYYRHFVGQEMTHEKALTEIRERFYPAMAENPDEIIDGKLADFVEKTKRLEEVGQNPQNRQLQQMSFREQLVNLGTQK